MQISVIVPLFNEEESLPELEKWIRKVMEENNFSYEILFINDGSKDQSWEVIQSLKSKNPHIIGLSLSKNMGKSAALQVGFNHANGDVFITMDADLQDSPDEIPELYRLINSENFDLISGWKQKRFDPISKTIPTKLYNWATRKLSGVYLHDFNCGLKAYKKQVAKSLKVYGEMHRYLPVQAKWNGFEKIGEKIVQHQSRKYGTTKFGMERFIYGFLDLLSISFVKIFGKRPMHLFGSLGIISFFLGSIITIYLIIDKLYNIFKNLPFRNLTDNPLFFIALVMVIIGVQLFLAGFLGELIITNSDKTTQFEVKEKI
ncbi:MAG: hypothetical protein RIR51_627 [Bacteroidota bacterium]|jgi:glycosyltransferase involved in cell wall biosynthesis